MKILLVEDNFLNQKLIDIHLKKQNHEIIFAGNGLEAIEKFKSDKYDLILMDIMMPEMDGLEATINIRKIEQENNLEKTPIIALTANDALKEKCFEVGMCEFMTKPFNICEFGKIVKKLLS